jgi:tRNA-(ms[2]io[6]A)-hydroxylase
MLYLHAPTPQRWLEQVRQHTDEILIDHAHCEKKAAGTAMNLLFAYVEHRELCQAMTEIVQEELDHFHRVLALLDRRGIRFRRLAPSQYGRKLHEHIRKLEPGRAVDRLLVAGLIEARSCERFDLLRRHLPDQELAGFYDALFQSEARHAATYIRLAAQFADPAAVEKRLHELAQVESAIIHEGELRPRMHS